LFYDKSAIIFGSVLKKYRANSERNRRGLRDLASRAEINGFIQSVVRQKERGHSINSPKAQNQGATKTAKRQLPSMSKRQKQKQQLWLNSDNQIYFAWL
jgi:hypothetical protein